MQITRQSLSTLLFYLFSFLLPVQLGTFFFFDFSYVSGVRIDYLAPALYLTDIIALSLILLHIDVFKKIWPKPYIIAFIGFILVILASYSPLIGFYSLLKLLEVIAIFQIAGKIKVDYRKLLIVFAAGALIQLVLGILQIWGGSSLQGVWYFLGERNFSLSTPGIAKVSIDGFEYLRLYGSFSHPNSLAGFYLLLYTFILFSERFRLFIKLKYATLCVMSLLIFLSFSKAAILTYLLVTLLYTFKDTKKICWICSISRVVTLLVIAALFLQAQGDAQSLSKRAYLAKSSLQIIAADQLTGTGPGNYLYAQSAIPNPYPHHFLEPVHNIALLAIAELGIPLFMLILYILFPYLKTWWKHDIGKALILAVLLTGMVDHYWLTLQQNVLILAVVFGVLTNSQRYDKINDTKS